MKVIVNTHMKAFQLSRCVIKKDGKPIELPRLWTACASAEWRGIGYAGDAKHGLMSFWLKECGAVVEPGEKFRDTTLVPSANGTYPEFFYAVLHFPTKRAANDFCKRYPELVA